MCISSQRHGIGTPQYNSAISASSSMSELQLLWMIMPPFLGGRRSLALLQDLLRLKAITVWTPLGVVFQQPGSTTPQKSFPKMQWWILSSERPLGEDKISERVVRALYNFDDRALSSGCAQRACVVFDCSGLSVPGSPPIAAVWRLLLHRYGITVQR